MMKVLIEECQPSYIFGNMAHLSLPGNHKLLDYEGETGMLPEWTAARGKDRTACFLCSLLREKQLLWAFLYSKKVYNLSGTK